MVQNQKLKYTRSWNMSRIRSKNTKPEMIVRRILHKNGFRYRLHDKELPGHPDIVFKSRKKVIFVNGCFWHRHNCRRGGYIPKTNTEYWVEKFRRNKNNMDSNLKRLKEMGWESMTVWECQLSDEEKVKKALIEFLS